MAQTIFERVEEKYLLDAAQLRAVQNGLIGRMQPDPFGRSTVLSLYYDTEDYRLIRTSLDKPDYKEKLRVRAYGAPGKESPVFVELKKKVDGVVYKRRAELTLTEADDFFAGKPIEKDTQVLREIRYFLDFYRPEPRVFLSYRRVAYVGQEQGLRITFDDGIRFRTNALMLTSGAWGKEMMPAGQTLMEIKALGAMPLWLCDLLAHNGIFPESFSKYGTCYRDFLFPGLTRAEKGAVCYA
ncbi:MAG: polyphosphate polymerase domain-containing protein [Clostridiaceae bacterium]